MMATITRIPLAPAIEAAIRDAINGPPECAQGDHLYAPDGGECPCGIAVQLECCIGRPCVLHKCDGIMCECPDRSGRRM